MNVLVTGGAGAVGSSLVERLLTDSHVDQITILDDLSQSAYFCVNRDERVRFVNGSVLDDDSVFQAFRNDPEIVYHLAGHVANQNSVEHPERDLMINGMGTLRILKAATAHGVSRFIYASSGCSIYGAEAALPVTEETVSLDLETPYQATKMLGEAYCNIFLKLYGLPTIRARFFTSYGPGELPGRYRNAVGNFLWQAHQGQTILITGDGSETRDFTCNLDLAKGLQLMAWKPNLIGEAINLASGTEHSVRNVIDCIPKVYTGNVRVSYRKRRDWDGHDRSWASIVKAKELLGYEPDWDLESGIAEAYRWVSIHSPMIQTWLETRETMGS